MLYMGTLVMFWEFHILSAIKPQALDLDHVLTALIKRQDMYNHQKQGPTLQ